MTTCNGTIALDAGWDIIKRKKKPTLIGHPFDFGEREKELKIKQILFPISLK